MEDLEVRTHMKMYLHTMSKLGFTLTILVFFVLFVSSVIVGAFGPPVFEYTSGHIDDVAQNWTGSITDLSKLHQQLILTIALHNGHYETVGYSQSVSLNISVEAKQEEESNWKPLEIGKIHTHQIYCEHGSQLCNSIIVAHEGFLDYWAYRYSLNIVGSKQDFIGNATFTFSYVNDAFTMFELWFRFAFLCFTFTIIVIFFIKLRAYSWRDWSVEQKWVSVLLFGLLAYNDPFFALQIMISGWFPPFFDILLFFTFLILLLFFWLVMFDGLRQEEPERTFLKFYLPKICLLGLFWIGAVTAFTMLELQELDDPSVILEGQPYYIFIQITVLGLFLIYAFWIGFAVIRAIGQMSSMPFLTVRLKFFGLFTLIIFAITVGGILFGFLSPISNNAAQFLSFLSLYNLYVFTLAFVYLPAKQSTTTENIAERIGVTRLEDEDDDTSLLMHTYSTKEVKKGNDSEDPESSTDKSSKEGRETVIQNLDETSSSSS